MAKSIPGQRLAASLLLGNDVLEASTLADEDVHIILLIHDGPQPCRLGMDVNRDLRDEDGVYVKAPLLETNARVEGLGRQAVAVNARGGSREIATTAAHDLVHDQHARVTTMFVDDVGEEFGALLRGRPRTKRLPQWADIVVDGLRQTDDREVIAARLQEDRQVSRGCVGVVATNGVQDLHLVLDELVSSHLLRVFPLFHQAALDAILDVGQLHPAVPDGAPAMQVQDPCSRPDIGRHRQAVPKQEPLEAAGVTDDLDRWVELIVPLDEAAASRREAWRQSARSEDPHALWQVQPRWQNWHVAHRRDCFCRGCSMSEVPQRRVDVAHHLFEPLLRDVKWFATLDTVELDGAQDSSMILVVADHARRALQRTGHGEVHATSDETEVALIGWGCTRVVAALLHHDLLCADELRELLAEPFAYVDGIQLHVAESVGGRFVPAGLHLLHDRLDTGALAYEDIHATNVAHHSPQTFRLCLNVQGQLRDVDRMHVQAFEVKTHAGHHAPGLQLRPIVSGRGGREVATTTAHDLVHNEHARVATVLIDDIAEELGTFLGRCPSAHGLTDRVHIVVDGLGHPDDREAIVVRL
mmetsp:Transcript_34630/g.73721  ORF Transcript_34630/g.73721 Transcript_34630/m.73721 type:complete len:584 (-) Transcript_34630:630-2381(-)